MFFLGNNISREKKFEKRINHYQKVDKGKLSKRIGRKVMGLKCFYTRIARLPALFLFKNTLLTHSFLDRKSTKKGVDIMITSRKKISHTIVLIILTIVVLVYSAIYSINSKGANIYSKEINIDEYTEDVNILTINGNINEICDSLTGVCGPPPGWYSTD